MATRKAPTRSATREGSARGASTAKTRATASSPAGARPPIDRDEVFARVEKRAAERGVKLRKGAAPRELAQTEKALGVALPDDLRAWYARHDGSAGDDPYLWPLALVRAQHGMYNHFVGRQAVVFAGIDDDVTGIDLSSGGAGQMFGWTPERGPVARGQSFLEWLLRLDWKW